MSTLKLLLIGLGSRLTIMGVGVVNIVLLARWLGPASIGEYFLLLRLVAVLTVLADFGLKQSANVFSGHHEDWVGRIHSILLRFTLLSWVGTSIAGAGVIWLARDILLPDFPLKWIGIAFLILPASLYTNFWNGMMIGRGRIWQLNLVQLVISAASMVLTVLFIVYLSGGVLAAVMIYLLTTMIQAFMMIIMAYRSSPARKVEDIPADLPRQMLSFGLRTHPGALSTLLWWNISVFLLNAFHGTAAVGIFSIAQQLVEKLLLPIQAMQDAIFKKVSVLPRHAATVAMNRYVRVTCWLMMILMLMGVILVPWIVMLLLGETYIRTAHIFRLLLPGTALISIPVLLAPYFLSQLRRPGLISILSWINTVTNLILALLLIPRLAEAGAAIALTTSQILGAVVALILYLRITQTRIKRLIYIDKEDVTIMRQQIGAIFGWKGNAG
jgi:O-antigen/teichoic acid export membrane protein